MNFQSDATAIQPMAFPQNMSNVIDSLKRLERIGSEESQTVQKILLAASELSEVICRCTPIGLQGRTVKAYVDGIGNIRLGEFNHLKPRTANEIVPRHCFNEYVLGAPGGYLLLKHDTGQTFVGLDRDRALAFSKDIANGLLEAITLFIEAEHKTSKAGLDAISAAKALSKTTSDPE